ncbi:MAG: hypothetical protein ABIP55_09690 [Tepidisphaeraceae bacterium]
MFAEDFGKARAPIERLVNETPLHDRSRPIVLNRAILDLVQKQYVMRGVRELSFYLSKHPAPDEEASNILGSALDLAGKNERLLNGAIYKEAFGEFARREFALERRRPGWKRWGAKWVTEEEFKAIQRRRDETDALIAEQWERVIRATNTSDTLRKQFDEAARRSRGFTFHRHGARGGGNTSGRYIQNCPLCEAQLDATMSMNDLQADALAANNELACERMEFDKLKKLIVKPQWPARYPPIRPDALEPPPPTTTPTPTTPAVATSAPSFPPTPETTASPATQSSGNASGR